MTTETEQFIQNLRDLGATGAADHFQSLSDQLDARSGNLTEGDVQMRVNAAVQPYQSENQALKIQLDDARAGLVNVTDERNSARTSRDEAQGRLDRLATKVRTAVAEEQPAS